MSQNSSIPMTGKQREVAREQEAKAAEKAEREARKQEEQGGRELETANSPLKTSKGVTTLEDSVVAKIAGMAAREVPGVYDMGNAMRRAFSAVTDRIPNSQSNVTGGISVEKGETQTAIDVTIVADYGVSLVEVGNNIRRAVINQVEGATGLEVVEVNVNVTDVHLPTDDNGKAVESRSNREGDLK